MYRRATYANAGSTKERRTEVNVPETANDVRYTVVTNEEGEYSIWPIGRKRPKGWAIEGTIGTKEECLRHIDRVWTDMRPRSLRDSMDR